MTPTTPFHPRYQTSIYVAVRTLRNCLPNPTALAKWDALPWTSRKGWARPIRYLKQSPFFTAHAFAYPLRKPESTPHDKP